jgi:hypothetical protein
MASGFDEVFLRVWTDLYGGRHAPLAATIIGVRAGLRDARAPRPAFPLYAQLGREERRAPWLRAWRDVARVFVLAVLIDSVYQILVVRWVYGEALAVALILVLVPYTWVRGPTNWIARRSSSTSP